MDASLRPVIVASLLSFALPMLGGGALAQDLGAGELIAKTQCAGCHTTGLTGPIAASDAVPSFSSVANMSGMTATGLEVFLSTPHARMPDYSLTRNEISNVSAYIMSLRRK